MAAKTAATASKKPTTKGAILVSLAETTGLKRKQIAEFFDHFAALAGENLAKRGPGAFQIPGLVKLTVVTKPAQPERQGINPFTKEPQTFKAKPAKRVVRVRPLKGLKDMAK